MAHVQSLLGGRYELREVLGRGAMGVVYRATDRVLGRDVAVKVLALDRAEDPTFVARFEREAVAVAALNHRSVVAVYDSGSDGHTHFIVMEYLRGASLARTIRERCPLPVEQAVEIAIQIAGALVVAHQAGIIHRDVKPANVMVDERGSVKVLDFGIAKASGVSLTQTATVLGSAPYLAPEVIRGDRADERSDIYSLGCVLYELLTGRPPFTGELPAAVLHQHSTVAPRPPNARRADTPAALDALVMRTLAKDPRSRPRSARVLVLALADSLKTPATPAPRVSGSGAETGSTRILRRARRRPARREALALALTVAVLAAGLVLVLADGSRSPRAHKAAAPGALATSRAAHAKTTAPTSRTPTHTTTAQPPANAPDVTNAPNAAAGARTLAGAAGALTSLVTSDYERRLLDKHAAEQLLAGLHDALGAYGNANRKDAVHKVGDLAAHVEQLAGHGDIQPSARPAIAGSINNLLAALESSPPPAAYGLGSRPAAGSEGEPGDHGGKGAEHHLKGPKVAKGPRDKFD